MIVAILGSFAVLAVLFLAWKRPKKQGPINEHEEASLPIHWDASERNKSIAFAYLAAWIIKKNAAHSSQRIAFVQDFFFKKFRNVYLESQAELEKALKRSSNVRNIARWVLVRMKTGEERLQLIHFLMDVAFVSGDMIDREEVAIVRFSELIGIPVGLTRKEIHKRRKDLYENGDEPFVWIKHSVYHRRKALTILLLNEEAQEKDIKRAYRKLAARYHPDKFELHSDEERQNATLQFLEIQEAYRYLMD